MFQVMATVFFTIALIAPVAIIALTLHENWMQICTALRGAPSSARAQQSRLRLVRSTQRLSSVSPRPRQQTWRAAA